MLPENSCQTNASMRFFLSSAQSFSKKALKVSCSDNRRCSSISVA